MFGGHKKLSFFVERVILWFYISYLKKTAKLKSWTDKNDFEAIKIARNELGDSLVFYSVGYMHLEWSH